MTNDEIERTARNGVATLAAGRENIAATTESLIEVLVIFGRALVAQAYEEAAIIAQHHALPQQPCEETDLPTQGIPWTPYRGEDASHAIERHIRRLKDSLVPEPVSSSV